MKIHSGICNYCGKEYNRPRPLRSRFCSKKCSKQSKIIYDIRNCLGCSKEFKVKSYIKYKYCSMKCFNNRIRGISKRTMNCYFCNRLFIRNAGNITQKYCSRICVGKSKQTKKDLNKVVCIICGIAKLILRKNYHKQVTCSRNCAVKYGKVLKYGPNYISVRDYKAERLLKDPSCEVCKWNIEPKVLEVHHKDRDRSNNTRPNLILACPNCHSIDHFKSKDGQFANNLGRLKEVA